MSQPQLDINSLQGIEPWQWPEGAGETIRNTLVNRQAPEADRVTAAELAGDLVVMDEEMAGALMTIVSNTDEEGELRAMAALSFGPVLEQSDIDGFEDPPFTDIEPHISENTFEKIQESLQRVYSDSTAPKEVRRRVLEASVRAPQDWHQDAIRTAYATKDREWVLTAVFCMRYVQGFEKSILEALNNKDEEIRFEAVNAAGETELEAAWPHVKGLVQKPGTPKDLLLAAIDAVAAIRPGEAREVLQDLADSDDEEIAEAANAAIGMAEARIHPAEDDDL